MNFRQLIDLESKLEEQIHYLNDELRFVDAEIDMLKRQRRRARADMRAAKLEAARVAFALAKRDIVKKLPTLPYRIRVERVGTSRG